MKFKLYFLVASLLIALFQEVAIASGVKTYRNNQLGFEISYLDNWEESHTFGNPAFFIKRKSPAEPGTISINIANFTGNKDDFMREVKAKPERFIEKYKRRFPSAEMIENGDTFLGGFPAYFISINYTLKNLNIEIDIVAMQIFCIKDNKIYLVSFETQFRTFEKTFNELQVIMASFNFL